MSDSPWRQEFWVPDEGPYLLTHSVGCMMRAASAAFERQYLEPWRKRGGDAWPDWLAAVDEFRSALAGLLGGQPAEYCPQANLSSGLSKLMGALPAPAAERNVLLISEGCFPSMAFVLGRAAGYRVRFLPHGALHGAELETWVRALAADDVHAALITHVHSATGVVAPIQQIAANCRARGVYSIIDVAQSAGILAVDVAAVDADAVLGSCVKWLCGGPGAGFLWVSPSLISDLEPVDVGWFSHQEPFEFDPHDFRFAADARRFWGGTPAVAPLVVAAVSIRRLAGIGIENVRAHNIGLQRLFKDRIGARFFSGTPAHNGGTCCISVTGRRQEVEYALHSRQVRFDMRGDMLRISFHIYNGEDDVSTVAAALDAAA